MSTTKVIRRLKRYQASCLKAEENTNTNEQFTNSPDLDTHILDAIMELMSSFHLMSNQVLASEDLRKDLTKILPGPVSLYEALRDKGEQLH